mgnify:CR=1 FL=1
MSFIQTIYRKITPFMYSNGFIAVSKCFYRIEADIAFCVELCMPSELLYVNFYLIPLYMPCKNRYYTYGNRLNNLDIKALPIIKKNANNDQIEQWCISFYDVLEMVVFPLPGIPIKTIFFIL